MYFARTIKNLLNYGGMGGVMMKRLLIIDQDLSYREILKNRLQGLEFKIDDFDSPIRGLEYLALNKYEIVISNLDLVEMSGLVFTRSVKNICSSTICIIVSDCIDDDSELMAIENEIELFFDKNKSVEVLIKYIEKLMENLDDSDFCDDVLISTVDNLKLYVQEHTVTKGKKQVKLTPKEFELLRIFLSNKNVVLSREYLVEAIWSEPSEDVQVRLVDPHIKRLRDKLRCSSLRTVRGYGYRWISDD